MEKYMIWKLVKLAVEGLEDLHDRLEEEGEDDERAEIREIKGDLLDIAYRLEDD